MKIRSGDTLFPPSMLMEKMIEFPISEEELEQKREIVNEWIDELKSGKLASSKEESAKPRFLHDFFYKILGFNENHPTQWDLDPEHKSMVDGTKPDAALGIFQLNEKGVASRVAAVVEIKDFNTQLDEKADGISPVEQAFSYAPKAKASWVFVSNFKEIRFYHGLDQSEHQKFKLEELNQNELLKQFILLCHRNALVHPFKSRTTQLLEIRDTHNARKYKTKKLHIIDELYKLLKEFDGLEFIDPNLIANSYPFNILDDYVWHYENYTLFSLNPEIYELLINIEITEGKLILGPEFLRKLKRKKVTDVENKLSFIFNKLTNSQIFHLAGVKDYRAVLLRNKSRKVIGFSIRHFFSTADGQEDSVAKKIILARHQVCDCVSCMFRSLDLNALLKKLKAPAKELSSYELAYGNYLVSASGYKKAVEYYSKIIKTWREKKRKPIEAYLAHYNLIAMFNVVSSYEEEDDKRISNEIKLLDLERLLWEDLHGLNKNIKTELKAIRDHSFTEKLRKRTDELHKELINIKRHYDRGGDYVAIGNYTHQLYHQFTLLYTYVNRNFIVADVYSDYQHIISQIMDGLMICHSLEKYPYRLLSFDIFLLSEMTLNISTQKLEEITSNNSIEVKADDLQALLKRLQYFLNSFTTLGAFEPVLNPLLKEYLLVYAFREKCGRIFSNIFILLDRIQITSQDWESSTPMLIINFLRVEDYLYGYQIDKFAKFLTKKGYLFSAENILAILKIAIQGDRRGFNKYQRLIQSCCDALSEFYPQKKMTDSSLLQKAIANSMNEKGVVDGRLIVLWKAVDTEGQSIIKELYGSSLDKQFHADRYETLLRTGIYLPDEKDYFSKYVDVFKEARTNLIETENGRLEVEQVHFYNFVFLLHQMGIKITDDMKQQFKNLSDFDEWILSPETFDYGKFRAEWLTIIWLDSFLPVLKQVKVLPDLVKNHLQKSYNGKLAEIYVKNFLN